MPYAPDGTYTLPIAFGTGTPADAQFPNKVGADLNDLASSIAISNIIGLAAFQEGVLTTDTSTTTQVGYLFTAFDAGTQSSGTFTPNAALGNYQFLTNGGAFAWDVPVADSAMDFLVTNNATAGIISFSGYKVASGNTGDPLTTTNGSQFIVSIRRINGVSTYLIKALQ